MSNLPDVYTIHGLRAAQGFVFKDRLSAKRWLRETLGTPLEDLPSHVVIRPAEVIYYGSNLTVDMKTTEQVRKEKA